MKASSDVVAALCGGEDADEDGVWDWDVDSVKKMGKNSRYSFLAAILKNAL